MTREAAPAKRAPASKSAPLPKSPPPSTAKPAFARTPKAAAAASRPYLRVYHSVALRTKTLALFEVIEQAEDPTEHREALAELVIELTNSGLDYCFIQPLKLAKPGFVVEQSATLGLIGVRQVIGSVARQIIGRMGGQPLLSVCGSIRRFML